MEVAGYVDDKTPYVSGENKSTDMHLFKPTASILLFWFKDKQIKTSEDKYHMILCIEETANVKNCC